MGTRSLPNVLPDGALKSISHNDLVIGKLNKDSSTKTESLDEKVAKKSDKEVQH